jgi:hypothetical protein
VSEKELPPPGLEACLVRLRASSQKGGTIIVEDVTDLETHERRLCDPGGYRPRFCPRCGGSRFHVHDYRWRVLRADPGKPETSVVRHVCLGCEAIWQTLPVFIARHLWRTWRVIEHELTDAEPTRVQGEIRRWPPVPERTRRRWRARWLRPVRFVAQVLASCGEATWVALAGALGFAATCADLVGSYASRVVTAAGHLLEAVAALIYRLQPKVRLM